MEFDPHNFTTKKQFGSHWFNIRPAMSSDRDLVWNAYKNVPQEYFKYINPISYKAIEAWYPEDKEINYEYSLPYNVMLLDDSNNEIEFAGNMTLIFQRAARYKHRAYMGLGVMPKFQKLGIGSFLTELSIEVAKAKPGLYRLELEVCSNNYAKNIYPKFGYREEAILSKTFLMDDGSLEDVIIMSVLFKDKFNQENKKGK